MPSILPKSRIAPTRINPKILVIYGMPKVGKTTVVSQLLNCLIADTERGAEMNTNMRVPVTSVEGVAVVDKDGNITSIGLDTLVNEIIAEAEEQVKAGKPVSFPYKWIAIDTLDKLEEYCEVSATRKYKESTIGKSFTGNSVLELPNGAGYYYLRNEVLEKIDMVSRVCKYLILVTHIKEKLLDKGGVNVSSSDISLTGKLSAMVCAKADSIAYLYRNTKKELMASFETNENSTMGSRCTRLAGRKINFDWREIYIEEPDLVVTE